MALAKGLGLVLAIERLGADGGHVGPVAHGGGHDGLAAAIDAAAGAAHDLDEVVLLFAALDARDLERLSRHGGNDLIGRGFVRNVHFLIGRAVKARRERARTTVEQRVKQPVLLRLEGADLIFTVDHDARGHRLHAAGGQAGLDLAPEQRAEFIAHDAVENAARLLCVDQILIDLARVLDALGDDLFRDLVERHALGLVIRQIQQLLQVPRNGLSLAVRVGREIDGTG